MDPGTFDRASLDAYMAQGVNRVSLGVQSFDAGVLKSAGRAHTVEESRAAIENVRASGAGGGNNQSNNQRHRSLLRVLRFSHLTQLQLDPSSFGDTNRRNRHTVLHTILHIHCTPYTLYSIHYIPYTLYSVHYTQYTVFRIRYPCTLYSVYAILHVHYTPQRVRMNCRCSTPHDLHDEKTKCLSNSSFVSKPEKLELRP